MTLEPLLEARELEEPVLLGLAVERDLVDRAGIAFADLRLGLEVGATRAIPALVQALAGISVVVNPLHDLADRRVMLGIRGPDEEVVGGVDLRHQRLEALGVAVGELGRRDALALGGVDDRLAVLVGPGQEEDVLAPLAHVAGEDVGRDRRVRVAEMGLGVDVVDRRRYVEGHCRGSRPVSSR